MFDLEGLTGKEKDSFAWPGRASVDALRGLPAALIMVDDDILRDEGEAYADKLAQAGVRVTSVRYNGTIHDFVMLNPLAKTLRGPGRDRTGDRRAESRVRVALGQMLRAQ